jgi:hypothetical protein
VEGFVGHWPTDLKVRIRAEFYANLNSAERDYGECRSLFDECEPISDSSLFGKLARNVASHLGRGDDAQTIACVLKASVEAYTQMRLEELVRSTGDVL